MPVYLRDILPVDLLMKHIEDGVVRKQVHPQYPDLFILNYSEHAQFGKIWDNVTNNCRGLIVHAPTGLPDAVVVARPFKKFHNLNTTYIPETMEENLPKDEVPLVTTKLDGSMGVLYVWDNLLWMATRGSFASEQARWATGWLRAHFERLGQYRPYHPWLPDTTPVFEVIYEENRIVVAYDFEGCVLLGIINHEDGREFRRDSVERFGAMYDFKVVPKFDKSLSECVSENTLNEEGYVLTYSNGTKVKVKFLDYCRLHKVLTGMNPRGIWELLAKNQTETVELILKDEKMPEQFKAWFSGWVEHLRTKYQDIERRAQAVFATRPFTGKWASEPSPEGLKLWRKTQALHFQKTPDLCSVLFAMLDEKPYAEIIWDRLKPRADERTFRKDGE